MRAPRASGTPPALFILCWANGVYTEKPCDDGGTGTNNDGVADADGEQAPVKQDTCVAEVNGTAATKSPEVDGTAATKNEADAVPVLDDAGESIAHYIIPPFFWQNGLQTQH